MNAPLSLSFAPPGPDPGHAEVVFRWGTGKIRRVLFRSPGQKLRQSGDALFCLGLLPALEMGADLNIDRPVHPDLLARADRIQALWRHWFPELTPIAVKAQPGTSPYDADRGAGLFFSGGVDSSYSLATAHNRLDALVTLIGLNAPVDDNLPTRHLRAMNERVARAYGLEPIIVETDIKKISGRFMGWENYHGSVLAAIRHLLADRLDNQLIAASADYGAWRVYWGSHPALDPLLGTPGAAIEHHGIIGRFTKIRTLIEEPDLMADLRVCTHQHLNCCVCRKCTFIMRSLQALDAFDRAPTFSQDLLDGARVRIIYGSVHYDYTQLLKAARARDPSSPLARMIERELTSYAIRAWFKRFVPLDEFQIRLKRQLLRWNYRRDARRSLA